jgi:hypothetical protein
VSGEIKSAKDKLSEFETKLDQHEEKIGLIIKPRISNYLNVTNEEMRKMSKEELDEAAFDLANYGLYLQKEINKHQARVSYAEKEIRIILARECSNYKAYSFEERKLMAIQGNEHASKLEEIRCQEQILLDRLNFMNRRIDVLADRFASYGESKRRNKYG